MSFKKNGSDPKLDPQEQGRFAWTGGFSFGPMLAAAVGMLVGGVENGQPKDRLRYRKSRRPQQSRRKHPNRLIISKRVRRKHRRAA